MPAPRHWPKAGECSWPMPGGPTRNRSSCATSPVGRRCAPLPSGAAGPPGRCRASRRSALCSAGTSARSPICSASNLSAIPSPTGWCCARARNRCCRRSIPDYPPDLAVPVDQTRRFIPEVAGAVADVQELPFGPIRADVVESAEFLFYYIGEAILHYQPRLFFKHRGMEKRFEGLLPGTAVVLAERISGVGSLAHALAYCQAVEAASGCTVPPRAQSLRVLLAELERLYNHLHYLGHLAHTTTLKVGEAEGKLLEERTKQLNARLTGSRFLRSMLIPGGLRRDLAPQGWLGDALDALRPQIEAYCRRLAKHRQPSRPADHHRRPRPRDRIRPGCNGPGRARLRPRSRSAPRPPLCRLWRARGCAPGARGRRRPCPLRGAHRRNRRQPRSDPAGAAAAARWAGAQRLRAATGLGRAWLERVAAGSPCSTPSISTAPAGWRGSRSNPRPSPTGGCSRPPCTGPT